jgi:hypothetical protein
MGKVTMDWRLSEGGKEKYSPAEQKLFRLLPKNGNAIDSGKLMDKFYGGDEMPVHGRTAMNVSLKRLMLKVQRNKEAFRIVRSERQGQQPIQWQVRPRR